MMILVQKRLKRRLLEVSFREKTSHLGSCLTALDAMIVVFDMKKAEDRFILSNGHAGLGLYVILEEQGLMDLSSMQGLHIHPDRCVAKGIYVSTGSLGQGLPIALGMAMADAKRTIYCMISDGECAEGSIWEALRISVEKSVKNLKIIVNANGWAAYQEVSPERLKAQFEGFGLSPLEVNGHSLDELKKAVARCEGGKSLVFAKTTVEQMPFLKGLDAHYYVMGPQDYQSAMEALQ